MMGTLLIDQSQTSLPSTNHRPVMTTNHRLSRVMMTRIVVSQYRTFLVNTSNLGTWKRRQIESQGRSSPKPIMQVILVCGNLWNLWNWPTMTRNRPTWPEIGPTWPEIGPTWPEIGPTWPQHPPTAEPHKINMIWLDIWRKICVVTSLTFRSQMSQIFNRQHSIFCYPSFVNRKSFKMTSRSIWLDAYFNV